MAPGPITSWEIDGETVETVSDFIFLGSKITADGYCSHEIKTFTPWKESYDQPRKHIEKQRHYFANKGPSSQGYGNQNHNEVLQGFLKCECLITRNSWTSFLVQYWIIGNERERRTDPLVSWSKVLVVHNPPKKRKGQRRLVIRTRPREVWLDICCKFPLPLDFYIFTFLV